MVDALKAALIILQHINRIEHPVHIAVLPGEVELTIELIQQALEKKPIAFYHPVSGRVRFDGEGLGASWKPLYEA